MAILSEPGGGARLYPSKGGADQELSPKSSVIELSKEMLTESRQL